MRRASKVDANQTAIVKALRAVGASVRSIAAVGMGAPDLVVGFRGVNYLLEVKDPSQPPSKRKLTPMEKLFADNWRGQYAVVETVEQAFDVVGAKR